MTVRFRTSLTVPLTYAELDENFATFGATHNTTYVNFKSAKGAVGSPAYSFWEDQNTGMYWYATDTLGFSAGGNDEFRVYTTYTLSLGSSRAPIFYDSNNTAYYTNPASTSYINSMDMVGQLDMIFNGNIAGGNIYLGTSTDSVVKYTNIASRQFSGETEGFTLISSYSDSTTNSVNIGGYLVQTNAATDIRFFTAANNATRAGTERMIINSSGNVGIGTSSPAGKLHATGDVIQQTSIESNQSFYLQIRKSRGSVDAPTAVVSNNDIVGGIQFIGYTGTQWLTGSGLRAEVDGTVTTSSAPMNLKFFTGGSMATGTERMRITAAGNVGIGTSSPGVKLDVNGTFRSTSMYVNDYLYHNGDTNTYIGFNANDTFVAVTAGTERLRIDSTGNLGVGLSSPGSRVEAYIDGDNLKAFSATGASSYIAMVPKLSSGGYNGISQAGDVGIIFSTDNNGSTNDSNGLVIAPWGPTAAGLRIAENGVLTVTTGGTQRMNVDSGGAFRVGGASSEAATIYGATGTDIVTFHQNRNGSTPYWYFNTSGGYGVYSDSRLKENIEDLSQEACINLIKNIKPVEFTWKPEYGDPTKKINGFLAQDVLSNATTEGQKNILTNWECYSESDQNCPHLGLSDHRMLPSIVGTIQYVLDIVETQQKLIEAMQEEINQLKAV